MTCKHPIGLLTINQRITREQLDHLIPQVKAACEQGLPIVADHVSSDAIDYRVIECSHCRKQETDERA